MPDGHRATSSRSSASSSESLIFVWSAMVDSEIARSSRRWRSRAPKLSHMQYTPRRRDRRGRTPGPEHSCDEEGLAVITVRTSPAQPRARSAPRGEGDKATEGRLITCAGQFKPRLRDRLQRTVQFLMI